MKNIGDPLPRRDGRAKVTGQARYSYEVPVSGVLYGVIVGSAVGRGRIASIDTREAEREPGVVAIFTHLNATRLPGLSKADPGDRVVHALQDDQVLYSGQPIALAVADTFERATHAAFLVRATFEQEQPRVDLVAMEHTAKPQQVAAGGSQKPSDTSHGDVDGGLAHGALRLDAAYETPFETHNPLEPHATIAVWEGRERVTLYDATQGITGVRKKIAKAFSIDPAQVRVVTKFVGGGFGCKGSAWSHVVLTAMAAHQLQRPVKVVLTRQQMFGPVGFRPRTVQRLSLGAGRDGALTALRHRTLTCTSQFDEFLEPASMVSRHGYASPAIETQHRLVRLDIGTPTYDRAPGESSGSFALESALDELAIQLRIDPLELRLKNYAERDPDDGKPFSSKSLRQCYALGASKFGWSKRPRAVRDGRWVIGCGMATASYPANQAKASAVARLMEDGTVTVESGAVDIGTGTYTVMAQVAADALGMPVEKVRFDLGDTAMPEAPRSGGSTTAASVASALIALGAAVRKKLALAASEDAKSALHGVPAEQIAIKDGRLTGAGKSEDVADLVRRAGAPLVQEVAVQPEEERKQYSLHSFGAQFAEVGVDAELGEVRVRRLVGAFGCGRILNARLARSQLMGGMVWGISMALHEHTAYDDRLGRIVTKDLADYHVPVHADTPPIEVYFVEEEDAHVNAAGVKGIGEIGITGVAAAIANAVFAATGKRIRELPITPDKLL